MNAILNKNSVDLKGCCIYVALFPCNECTKLIIQAGIKEVIFYSDKYHSQPTCKASRRLLDLAGVNYRYLDLLLLLFRCNRTPVAQLVGHRAVTREALSSTSAGPTLRV